MVNPAPFVTWYVGALSATTRSGLTPAEEREEMEWMGGEWVVEWMHELDARCWRLLDLARGRLAT